MKSTTKTTLATLILLCAFATTGVQSALAFGGNHGGDRGGKIGGFVGREELVPQEMREAFREEFQNLSDEEKTQLREEMREQRREMRGQREAEMEEFTGLTREEMREAREEGLSMGEILADQGITEDDAEAFLTERANIRVDEIVERHDLDEEDEQTLRDRIGDFVNRILERWFE